MPKARKDHKCYLCSEIISKGTIYFFCSNKEPRYNFEGKQIGIEYTKIRIHEPNCLYDEDGNLKEGV